MVQIEGTLGTRVLLIESRVKLLCVESFKSLQFVETWLNAQELCVVH